MSALQKNQLSLSLIAILVCIKFLIMPWLDWISEKTDSIAQLATSQQRFQNVGERHAALVDKTQQIEQSFQQLKTLWVAGNSAQNSVLVLRYIETAAKQHGVEVSNRNAREPVVSDTTTIPARMFVQGSPEALTKFVHQLETRSPAMIVRKMTLNKNNQLDTSLVMNLEVIVPVEPEPKNENGK